MRKSIISEFMFYIFIGIFSIAVLIKHGINFPSWIILLNIFCISCCIIGILYNVFRTIMFFKKVRELEDKIDIEDARKAIEESEKDGCVSWEEVKKKLNLKD